MSAPARHLVAVDLDGTLFGADARVSARTREALEAASRRGHDVVAVTGRSRWSALERLAPVTSIARVVGANGAYLHDVASGALAWSHPVAAAEARRWMARVRERLPDASFGSESAAGVHYEPRFLAEAFEPESMEHGGASEAEEEAPLFKLYIRSPSAIRGALQAIVRPLLGDAAEVSTSGAPFVEATAPGANKGTALARVAEGLGVPLSRTVAFGDNLNDVPMLSRAGLSVAMGNALPEVRALTDRVAPANVEDGVARVLEELMAEGRL